MADEPTLETTIEFPEETPYKIIEISNQLGGIDKWEIIDLRKDYEISFIKLTDSSTGIETMISMPTSKYNTEAFHAWIATRRSRSDDNIIGIIQEVLEKKVDASGTKC